jgi:hypothetical protein
MVRLGVLLMGMLVLACSGPPDTCSTNDAGPTTCGTDTWASYGQGFFDSHCSSCHGSFDQATVQSSLSVYTDALSSGVMPRGGGLSDCDRARAVSYLQCGAP